MQNTGTGTGTGLVLVSPSLPTSPLRALSSGRSVRQEGYSVLSKFSQEPWPHPPNPLPFALLSFPPWYFCVFSLSYCPCFLPQAPFPSSLLFPPPSSLRCWCGWLFWCYWFCSIKDCSIQFLYCGPAPDLRVGPKMTELITCTASPEGLQPHSLSTLRQEKTVKVNMIHKL